MSMTKTLSILLLILATSGCVSDSTFWQPQYFDHNKVRSANG